MPPFWRGQGIGFDERRLHAEAVTVASGALMHVCLACVGTVDYCVLMAKCASFAQCAGMGMLRPEKEQPSARYVTYCVIK